ncbi:MAG: hypothetical protein A2104_04295 [Candidatus Melainabacteria bacterium GWF2_32_7]|nr:MAG: hypothetical protein A2104_04295 [Candidatus Melainabacteria bacterium GWF2_32_7]
MVNSLSQNNNINSARYSVPTTILNNNSQYMSDLFKNFYFVKPTAIPPKGHLIKGTMIPRPVDVLKEYCSAAKTFYKALKGEGGDYEIGKLNDSAIGLGSLGIASLLASKATTPMAKAMEFVGFGTWFLAMSVWPKFFIGKPVKMLTGVDINQEYVDSQGRRKRFFQDPQYLPWDLMSDEQINKVGNKLRIPENIENRREAIQDKMKQIATQSNTLWMLTAGFSTPILSSLMADKLRDPVKKLLNIVNTGLAKFKLSAVNGSRDLISSLINKVSNMKSSAGEKKLGNLLAEGNSAGIKEFFTGLSDKLTSNEVKTAISEKISDIGNSTKKEEVLGLYKKLTGLLKADQALYGYHKATLVNGIGNSWADVSKNILKALKMPKDLIKKLADANVDKRADIIAQHLHSMKPEELAEVVHKVTKVAGKPVNQAKSAQGIISTFIQKPFKRALESIIGNDNAVNIAGKVENSLGNRVLDIESSFDGVVHALKNSKGKSMKVVTRLLGGIKSSDALTELTEVMKKGGEKALRNRLGESLTSKKTIDKIIDVIKNQDSSQFKSLGKWLGQTPQDLIADAARDTVTYNNWLTLKYRSWFQKVGLIGGGVLLGLTLFTILRMGKSNNYNPDVYKSKEVAGNEPSK